MHLRHAFTHQVRRLTRRYSFLRRTSITTTLLTLVWLYTLYWGERSTFAQHIKACDWKTWEKWPADATPHHLVLVADPQLVDPHTYPGRPWPLSTLTERYTDLYMSRNFRLINSELDPDSVVFLGDLFDGGREWAPSKAPPLKAHHLRRLEKLGIIKKPEPKDEEEEVKQDGEAKTKRSQDSYAKAVLQPHRHAVNKKDHFLTSDNVDLKAFVPGEGGRWSAWDQKQWDEDYARFTSIFFEPAQLYPHYSSRHMFPAYELGTSATEIENGAHNDTHIEYATSGGKQRRLITSLPGNHDVGFGSGVQLAVRDRFHYYFGETNRIDVLGNHTFISVDTPSLSASGQFVPEGGESTTEQIIKYEHVWKPTMDFLEDLRTPAARAVEEALHEFYPGEGASAAHGYKHSVHDSNSDDPYDLDVGSSKDSSAPRPQLPVILLTHVPLYRDSDTDCGKHRESGHAIRVSAGYQYQNVLTRSISNSLANRISAAGELVHAFSGDDHDYCDVMHRYNVPNSEGGKVGTVLRTVKEITVKSFSWAMGVRKPGFQLVSLWNPVDEMGRTVGTPLPTVQSHLCELPDQLGIFIRYALLLGFTLAVLLVRAVVVGLRFKPGLEGSEEREPESPRLAKLTLPRFKTRMNGTANGHAAVFKEKHGRHRASSTSTSTNHNSGHNSGASLGVQRSYNARTRSVSPAVPMPGQGSGVPNLREDGYTGPLIEKAGFYPQVRWADPSDADEGGDSDEESHIGSDVGALGDYGEEKDEKWKRRRRTGGSTKVRKAVGEFFWGVLVVGGVAGGWYWWLVSNG